MRLTLHYRGILRANGTPSHKHDLRRHFHEQLATLWRQKPLAEQPELILPRVGNGYCLLRPLSGTVFVPLISEEMNAVAELEVSILRPEPPGGLLTQGGDIDNRLKTLFDSLTMPRHLNQLPPSAEQASDSPFFCLLEDDNLVTSVSVRTEQLLEPIEDKSVVDLRIRVRTRVTRETIGNDSFA
ncbi:hypothetical protein [Polaromonas sp.]|uniref:hypothetical protein n=1 Tax=Polaromonas sp. TaxID=1869339 RepID=UPI002731E6F3|nr:hypothetical protein [Polaromonas sp.]MDP1740127.1 hypothetical protein [Polaromonas sp.]